MEKLITEVGPGTAAPPGYALVLLPATGGPVRVDRAPADLTGYRGAFLVDLAKRTLTMTRLLPTAAPGRFVHADVTWTGAVADPVDLIGNLDVDVAGSVRRTMGAVLHAAGRGVDPDDHAGAADLLARRLDGATIRCPIEVGDFTVRVRPATEQAGGEHLAEIRRRLGGLRAVNPNLISLGGQLPGIDLQGSDLRGLTVSDVLAGDAPEESVETAGDRHVDLALRTAAGDVRPGAALLPDAKHTLSVRIGRPFEASIVTGRTAAIEADLPVRPDGWDLTVTVTSASLRLGRTRSRRLRLPTAGASGTVEFTLTTPAAPGPVDATVAIHLDGALIQAYSISGRVGPGMPGLRAELVHSASAGLGADLDQVGPRAVSLLVGETIQVYVRDGGAVRAPLLTEAAQRAMEAVRAVLTGWVDEHLDKDEAARRLAARGAELRRALFDDRSVRDAMRTALAGSGDVVQVVRVHPHLAVPWAAVRDWWTPTDEKPYEVCWEKDCPHDAATVGTLCMKGFWGVRHAVEELFADQLPAASALLVAPGTTMAVYALGVADAAVSALPDRLDSLAAPLTAVRAGTANEFMDLLWSAERAPIALVLGHHEAVPGGDRSQADARFTVGSDDALTVTGLGAAADVRPDWDDRPPLVLLLGCSTGEVRPADLVSFLSTLHGCGAAAVVCTESAVWSDSAAEIAATLLGLLAGGPDAPAVPLAAAVHGTRQHLVHDEGDLSAFTLTAIGSARLALAPA